MSTFIRYLRLSMHTPAGEKQPIGYLSQYGDILRLSFDASYVNDPRRPTLSMSLRGVDDAATRQILLATRDERLVRSDGHWPVFFQNLLPEGHNRERLAAQRGCTTEDEFELLAAAGHDLMGALEVEPVPADEDIPQVVRHWHAALGLDVLEPGFVELPVEDAASLPGMVTKFSAVQEGRRYVVKRHGAAGSHILKLPTTRHPELVENEYTGYRLCAALGLDCARASVITREQAQLPEPVDFPHILAVERFDRRHGLRVHMEEFAQAMGYAPRHKYGRGIERDYGQMLRLLNQYSAQPARDTREFLGRFLAFILMGNTDAHLKNWALIYPDGIEPQLAPLYDPVCVSAFFAGMPPTDYGINRAIDGKLRAFTWAQFESLLEGAGLLRRSAVLRHCKALVQAARADWPALLADAPRNMREEIMGRLRGGVALTA